MTDIKWEEPPVQLRGKNANAYKPIADALRARPGEWALIHEDVSSTHASAINGGRIKAFQPAGAFEARCQADATTRRGKVWARFVGDPS